MDSNKFTGDLIVLHIGLNNRLYKINIQKTTYVQPLRGTIAHKKRARWTCSLLSLQTEVGKNSRNHINNRPSKACILQKPDPSIHIILLLSEESEKPLEVSSVFLLVLCIFRGLEWRHIARGDYRDAQGVAHDWKKPFGDGLATEFHCKNGRDPNKHPAQEN